MPGRVRVAIHNSDPVRKRGRIPLSKRRSKGKPQFRPAGLKTVSALEEKIADSIVDALMSVPHQMLLEAVENASADDYGLAVLSRLSEASEDIEEALMEAFVASGETSALEVARQLATEYRRVGKADAPLPSEVAMRFKFDRTDPRAIRWVKAEAGQLITNMTNESRLLIRNIVQGSFESQQNWMQNGKGIFNQLATVTASPSAKQFAETLGSNLNGLTTRYERAVMNRVSSLADDFAARGITGTKALEAMRKEGDRYSQRLRRARSRTIARTERMRAHNQARLLSYQQAVDSGLASAEHSLKEWQTGPFDVCPICVSTAGQKIKVNEQFTLPSGQKVDCPPAHPNCRCTMTMITDTRLYEPPERLGTGVPGDPFRTTPRGFTQTGQQLSQQPLTGIPAPPASPPPTTDTSSALRVDVSDLQESIEKLPAADDQFLLTKIVEPADPNKPMLGGKTWIESDKWQIKQVNKVYRQEAEEALDATLQAGYRARRKIEQLLVDEFAVIDRDISDAKKAVTRLERRRENLDAPSLTKDEQVANSVTFWKRVSAEAKDEARPFIDEIVEGLESRRFLASNERRFFDDIGTGMRDFDDLFMKAVKAEMDASVFNDTLMLEVDSWIPTLVRELEIGDLDSLLKADPNHRPRFVHRFMSGQYVNKKAAEEVDNLIKEAKEAVKVLLDSRIEVRQRVIQQVLAASREGFGTGSIRSKISKITGRQSPTQLKTRYGRHSKVTKKQIEEQLDTYSTRVPKEWIEMYDGGHSIGWNQRAYYSYMRKQIKLSGDEAMEGGWRATLQHEITHGHEYTNNRLLALEHVFQTRLVRQRAYDASTDDIRLVDIYPYIKKADDKEWGFDLQLGDSYATKVYRRGNAREISTRGVEVLWYEDWSKYDSEWLDFVLGTLLMV